MLKKETLEERVKELEKSHTGTQETILTLRAKQQQLINSNQKIQDVQRQMNQLALEANNNLAKQEMLKELITMMEEEDDPKKKSKADKKK